MSPESSGQGSTKTPVALIIFNRPDLTRHVMSALKRVRPERLLVVADGPRPDRPDDVAACQTARAIAESTNWPCRVETCYADRNLGCRLRVSSGLDWVFERTERAIILEEDCVPDPSFFPYCESLLDRYADDERVHMISGTNLLFGRRFTRHSYYFSRFFHIWGWATWARAWRHYDLDMKAWPELRDSGWLERILPDARMVKRTHMFFEGTWKNDEFSTWDYQWVFSGWLRNAVSAVPSRNLITNIGFGPAATHTRVSASRLAWLERHSMQMPVSHPSNVEIDERADKMEFNSLYRVERTSPKTSMFSSLKTWLR